MRRSTRSRPWSPIASARTSERRAAVLHAASSHAKIFAQIVTAHVGMVDDLVGRPFGQNMTAVDDIGAVDQTERLANIVIGDQHTDAATLEVTHQILNVADRDWVDAGEGLVEQHERGFAG